VVRAFETEKDGVHENAFCESRAKRGDKAVGVHSWENLRCPLANTDSRPDEGGVPMGVWLS